MSPRLLVMASDPGVREAVAALLQSAGYDTGADAADGPTIVAAVVVSEHAASPISAGPRLPAGVPVVALTLADLSVDGAVALTRSDVATTLLTRIAVAIGNAALARPAG